MRFRAANATAQRRPDQARSARPRSLVAIVGCAVAAASLLSGCGSVFNSSDKGFALTVPVLWAGQGNDGQPTGGIESAGVWAGEDSKPGYSVDLAGIEAQGAGTAWQAASGTAASVGAFFSSADPTSLGIRFTITGPIDGPSGGAALTIGVVAATRHQQLRPGVTMTGTIAPDGSIGKVSGIPSKLRAAAEAGYRTVLLPTANMTDRSATNIPTDMAEYGRGLGLDVVAVDDLSEAYPQMTGSSLGDPPAAQQPLTPPVNSAASQSTGALIARFDAALSKSAIAAAKRTEFASDLTAAKAAQAAGNSAKAYAMLLADYRSLLRSDAATQAAQQVKNGGSSALAQVLAASAQAVIADATATRERYASTTNLGTFQELSIPAAIAPLTYAIAVATNAKQSVETDPSGPDLITAASTIADQRASIDTAATTSFAVVSATPSTPSNPQAPAANLLSGYTNFLMSAGNANQEYFNDVLGGRYHRSSAPNSLSALVKMLGEQTATIPANEQDLSTEFIQSSQALSYFIFSTALVTDMQSFDIRDEELGGQGGLLPDPQPVANSIATGSRTVDGLVAGLSEKDVDAGLANWLRTWGAESAELVKGSSRETAGSLVALHQIWGATVNALILETAADREAK